MLSRLERFTQALGYRYAVERELGSGATATVFLANDIRYQRRVAVKVFRPEIAEALGHERFVREITLVAKLNHPHIVPLLDSGEVEDLMFYVMPAIEGESLADRLRREPQLPVDDAIQIARDVAVALDYAHGRNVVHRDVKPENILLTAGTAVVADFGIAKMLNAGPGGTSITRTGITLGTVMYMSPEQASAGEVDGRTDIYALGCVLFEMLAGRPPFVGTSARAVVARHFTDPVPSLHALRTEIAPSLEAAINKALAKNPEERFSTATEFITELAAARRAASRERMWRQLGGRTPPPKSGEWRGNEEMSVLQQEYEASLAAGASTPQSAPTVSEVPSPADTKRGEPLASVPNFDLRWMALGVVVVAVIAWLVLR